MYNRILGVDDAGNRNDDQNDFLKKQQTMANEQSVSNQGTLIHNQTINQQIKSRHIVRNQFGQPLGQAYKKTFVPASKVESKNQIKNDVFTMHETSYNA